jgi:hypothetical protein
MDGTHLGTYDGAIGSCRHGRYEAWRAITPHGEPPMGLHVSLKHEAKPGRGGWMALRSSAKLSPEHLRMRLQGPAQQQMQLWDLPPGPARRARWPPWQPR